MDPTRLAPDVRRDKPVLFMLNTAENQALRDAARDAGLTLSDFLRRAAAHAAAVRALVNGKPDGPARPSSR
jgi:hypothetical protein